MKFYGIEVEGQLELKEVSELPVYSAEFRKCLVYNTQDNLIYFGADTEWKKVGDGIEFEKIVGILDPTQIPILDSSKISSGILDTTRIPNLDASKITTGTINVNRLPNLPITPTSITETSTNSITETTHTHAVGNDSNAYGRRYISSAAPSGGVDGDVWLKY